MNTLTLGWERCDLCGRRGVTIRCLYGGEALNLCPHCLTMIYPKRGLSCRHLYAVLPSLKELAVTANGDIVDTVEKAISKTKQTSRARFSNKRKKSLLE